METLKDRMRKQGTEEFRKKTDRTMFATSFLASSLPAFLILHLETFMPRGDALCSL
jgi:hypothetical protein